MKMSEADTLIQNLQCTVCKTRQPYRLPSSCVQRIGEYLEQGDPRDALVTTVRVGHSDV